MSPSPIAVTAAGKVEGLDKDGLVQFRGIRYATAARFGPPEPAELNAGVLDATAFGPIAPQNHSPLETMLGAQQMDSGEDCLYLNVFTPAPDDDARPVLVWIHGGGFTAGTGSISWYDGSRLVAAGDVVVVTINYRLGALGFLAVDGIPGSGCAGLGDQIAALRWVRDNIAAFGGDPARVTVFGESAGAMSIGSLLAAPAAAGLFTNAILQSGTGEFVHTAESAAEITAAMIDALGSRDSGVLLDASVDQILAAQQTVDNRRQLSTNQFLPFMPVVDGVVLDRRPIDAVRAGAAAGIRVLAGTTSDEWNLFHVMERASGEFDEAKLNRRLDAVLGDRASDLVALYRADRPDATVDDLWCAIATDWVFRMPAVRLLEAQSTHQPDTWAYEMTLRSTALGGQLGACHALDVPFVFDNLDRPGVDLLLGGIDDAAVALGSTMSRAWLAMANTGSPQHAALPTWRQYSSADRAVMALGREVTLMDDPRAAEREAWTELLPR
ncbi:MAG: carboxylesterase/lipase family protein [Acidimicrobiales bacterium]